MTKQEELFNFVKGYVEKHKISCPESIHQCDELQLDSPEFMEKCVDIVGYFDGDNTEEDIL